MNAKSLIAKLAEHGITATEDDIKAQLGDISSIEESDIADIAALWNSTPSSNTKIAKATKPAKSESSIAKLDTNNLPEVSSLSNAEVGQYINQLEQMDAHGHPLNDEAIGFLLALYDRRKEAIEFVHNAVASFKNQDAELAKAEAALNDTVNGSVKTLQSFNSLMQQIGQGGARLGDNFRSNTTNMRAAADRFKSHVAAQSNSSTESAA